MSDTTRSPEDIEREARRQRSEVREIAEELRHRFSPETLMDNAADYLRGSGGTRMAAAIRENPLAAVMAGAGIAWLFYTMQKQQDRLSTASVGSSIDDPLLREDYPSRLGETEPRVRQTTVVSEPTTTVVRH